MLSEAALTALAVAAIAPAGAGAAGRAPVNVGLIAPQGTAAFNETLDIAAVKAAVRMLNRRGGLAGHRIDLVYCNDKGDPNQTAECGRQMIAKKVVAMAGGALLNGGTVLTPMLAKAHIPQVGLIPVSAPEYSSPNVYLFGSGALGSSAALVALAVARKLPTGIAYSDNTAGQTSLKRLEGMFTAKGQHVAAEAPVEPTQADYAPVAQKLLDARAVLTYVVPQLGGGGVLRQMVTAQQFKPLTETGNPLVEQYLRSMRAEVAAGDRAARVGAPGGESSIIDTGWLALWALDAIARRQHLTTLSAATITRALDRTRRLDMKGVMAPWTPNEKGAPGLERDAGNDRYFFFGWNSRNQPHLLGKTAYSATQILAGEGREIAVPR
jgi:ABC-type branched-subunit amino acid transport system substrate-binding protein